MECIELCWKMCLKKKKFYYFQFLGGLKIEIKLLIISVKRNKGGIFCFHVWPGSSIVVENQCVIIVKQSVTSITTGVDYSSLAVSQKVPLENCKHL